MTPTLGEFINEVVQKEGLRLYFDTTVILDLLRPERRPESQQLLQIIGANRWTCISSYYARMEALDAEQEHMWLRGKLRRREYIPRLIVRPRAWREIRRERELRPQDLTRISNEFHKKLVTEIAWFIKWVDLDKEGWEEATTLASGTSISAPDSIHVATALRNDCHILVTSDEALREVAANSIRLEDPKVLLGSLKELGETTADAHR